jgi:hypothetical protein
VVGMVVEISVVDSHRLADDFGVGFVGQRWCRRWCRSVGG